jgi:hypothetical protein
VIRPLSAPIWAVLAVVFAVLATLNAAGYRYGVSDQAFYIPAISAAADAALFPRDRLLIGPQGGLTVLDDLSAWLTTSLHVPLPWIFFTGFVATLFLLVAGYGALGGLVYRSAWTTAAFCLAMTLRHRIPRTGANTLEGYFHPRVLAFSIGLFALWGFLTARTVFSIAAIVVAGIIHPTTGAWFAMALGVAMLARGGLPRRIGLAGAGIAAMVAVWALGAGPLRGALVTMDPEWLQAFRNKDYVFPNEWDRGTWVLNLAYPAMTAAGYWMRRRAGLTIPREDAFVLGVLSLVPVFLISLPFIASNVALAVQLQFSRIFWVQDVIGSLYLTWILAEGAARTVSVRRAAAVALVMAVAATARGIYVGFFAHPERGVVQFDLPPNEWHDMMRWLQTTPSDTHVLADAGHAWRYGSSVRVAGLRDVYLEEVKDTAMSLYSRDVAMRVVSRIRTIGSQDEWTESSLQALAADAGLSLVITERRFDLPVAYENARFRAYRLAPVPALLSTGPDISSVRTPSGGPSDR